MTGAAHNCNEAIGQTGVPTQLARSDVHLRASKQRENRGLKLPASNPPHTSTIIPHSSQDDFATIHDQRTRARIHKHRTMRNTKLPDQRAAAVR